MEFDLNNVVNWFSVNDLVVHVKKLKDVIFSKFDIPFYDYKINGASIQQCSSIKDLGEIVYSKLTSIPKGKDVLTTCIHVCMDV